VSTDEIREAKWPNEPYQKERNAEVFDEFHRCIGELLESGRDAVADATSLQQAARWRLSDMADYYDAEKHLIFFANNYQAQRRNAARTGAKRVPDEAQEIMLAKHKEARYDILNELYTSTTIIEATQ
jgi:predicted kinase